MSLLQGSPPSVHELSDDVNIHGVPYYTSFKTLAGVRAGLWAVLAAPIGGKFPALLLMPEIVGVVFTAVGTTATGAAVGIELVCGAVTAAGADAAKSEANDLTASPGGAAFCNRDQLVAFE